MGAPTIGTQQARTPVHDPSSPDEGAAARVGKWIGAWAENDHAEPHVRLGPLGVDAHLQDSGSQILREHKAENVTLHERFGYVVSEE